MYNRYIPQSDGSHRRSRMPDPPRQPQPVPPPPRSEPRRQEPPRPCPEPEPVPSPPPPEPEACPEPERPPCPPPQSCQENSAGSFLRGLLPKDFSTGDLLIVLLLLLIAGDCPEDRNSAMLTLALYLFM